MSRYPMVKIAFNGQIENFWTDNLSETVLQWTGNSEEYEIVEIDGFHYLEKDDLEGLDLDEIEAVGNFIEKDGVAASVYLKEIDITGNSKAFYASYIGEYDNESDFASQNKNVPDDLTDYIDWEKLGEDMLSSYSYFEYGNSIYVFC